MGRNGVQTDVQLEAIKIIFERDFDVEKHFMFDFIEQYPGLKRIFIENGKNVDIKKVLGQKKLEHLLLHNLKLHANDDWTMEKYPSLISFEARKLTGFSEWNLRKFIGKNDQIENLVLVGHYFKTKNLLDLSGKLNHLKTLRFEDNELLADAESTIEMENLISLEADEVIQFERILNMFRNCKKLRKLALKPKENTTHRWDDRDFNILLNFPDLQTLKICCDYLPFEKLHRIINEFGELTSLRLYNANNTSEVGRRLMEVIEICNQNGVLILKISSIHNTLPEMSSYCNLIDNYVQYGTMEQIELINYGNKKEIFSSLFKKGQTTRFSKM